MPASQYTSLLPDPLRLKPNGLQMDQLGVYAEFARMKPAVATDGPVQDGSPAVSESVAPAYALENRPAAPTLLTVQQAVEKFNVSSCPCCFALDLVNADPKLRTSLASSMLLCTPRQCPVWPNCPRTATLLLF